MFFKNPNQDKLKPVNKTRWSNFTNEDEEVYEQMWASEETMINTHTGDEKEKRDREGIEEGRLSSSRL